MRGLLALLTSVALIPELVFGQSSTSVRSNTSRFFLGASVSSGTLRAADLDGTESGSGMEITFGYGFNKNLALVLDGSAVDISAADGDWILGHGDLAIRYHFASASRRFVPYLQAGVARLSGTREDVEFDDGNGSPQRGDLEISGPGNMLGAGLLYFFNPRWAFTVDAKWTDGHFDTVKFENVSVSGFRISATSSRLNLGVTWFPKGKR